MKKIEKIIKITKKYKVQIICIVIILFSIISVIMQYLDKNNEIKVNSLEIKNKNEKIAVYINGEVKNPGVYYLDEGARLYELLDLCGGVKDSADINNINLAKKLVDSDMITITRKKENKEDDEILQEDDNENSSDSDKVNINSATKSELMSINGIGEQTANKIIEYRNTTKFTEIEDIMNVNGIGPSKFENIKSYICVD